MYIYMYIYMYTYIWHLRAGPYKGQAPKKIGNKE